MLIARMSENDSESAVVAGLEGMDADLINKLLIANMDNGDIAATVSRCKAAFGSNNGTSDEEDSLAEVR